MSLLARLPGCLPTREAAVRIFFKGKWFCAPPFLCFGQTALISVVLWVVVCFAFDFKSRLLIIARGY